MPISYWFVRKKNGNLKIKMKYSWSIIGHEKQLERIESDIESGNLAHAYLLSGPNSVGKHTVSKKMAGILQCENDFCHDCKTCLQVSKGSHIDTIELIDDKNSLKIEEMRKVMDRLNMSRQSKYKVLIIQSIERMTTEAANSFLKMLEEPPPKTIFILTTNDVNSVIETLISRVRIIKFGVVSSEYLYSELKKLYPEADEDSIHKACLFAMGKTGKALNLLENPEVLAEYMEIYHKTQNILNSRNIAERFLYVEELSVEKEKTTIFFNILTHVLRSKMLDEKSYDLRIKYTNSLSKIAETAMLLKRNINFKLALENLMLAI